MPAFIISLEVHLIITNRWVIAKHFAN